VNDVIFFRSINLRITRDRIYRRLRYKENTTRIDEERRKKTENDIDYALSLIDMKGACVRVALVRKETDRIFLSTGEVFVSRDLAKYIRDSEEILVMGATAGDDIMNAIREDVAAQNLTRGSILDAVASEMTDGTLDWICGYFDHQLKRENKRVARNRYSAGYGDLDLENQRIIHRMLGLERIGVSINESHILIPEKSVTAIARIIKV
jgi:cobalamin-dependent methionine synthase I